MNMKEILYKYKHNLTQLAELGWQEQQTTTYIQKALKIKPLKRGFGKSKTGLLYQLGKGQQKILLRADIDALQTKTGPRHICGHSSHTAALMLAFQQAAKQEKQYSQQGKAVYFLFQPAEETFPSGAQAVMDEFFNQQPLPKYAFSCHVRPKLPLGQIQIGSQIMARGDYAEVEFFGQQVHVKQAAENPDVLEAAAKLILQCRSFQKQNRRRLRLNFGVIKGGQQANTVAEYCLLKGDIRLKNDKLQDVVKQFLQKTLKKIEQQTKIKSQLHYFSGYPSLVNHPQLAKKMQQYFAKNPDFKLSKQPEFSFGCEDFSFFSAKVPSVYALIGTGDKHEIHEPNCRISDQGTWCIFQYFQGLLDWWKFDQLVNYDRNNMNSKRHMGKIISSV